jgi:hypothetical protein
MRERYGSQLHRKEKEGEYHEFSVALMEAEKSAELTAVPAIRIAGNLAHNKPTFA